MRILKQQNLKILFRMMKRNYNYLNTKAEQHNFFYKGSEENSTRRMPPKPTKYKKI